MQEINNTKYTTAIRISHTATGSYGNYVVQENDWNNLPVPTALQRRLHDADVNAFTDLLGFTHRNRVRHDVEDFDLGFAVLNDDDERTLLNLISPEWIYVELIDKKQTTDITDTNGYTQYTKDGAIYWYDSSHTKLYDASYNEVSPFTLSQYTKSKTNKKTIHKMYANDKEWGVYHLYQDSNNNWHEVNTDFSFSLVEE